MPRTKKTTPTATTATTEVAAPALTVIVREYRSVKDGKVDNPAPISIPTDKGVMSICGHIAHTLHKQTQQKLGGGIKQKFAIFVNDELAFQIGDGFTLKVTDKEGYLKDAGFKRDLSLNDFKIEWTLFKDMFHAMAGVIRYHLGTYLPDELIAESYVKDAKTHFGVTVSAKTDNTSFRTQSKAIIEKSAYNVQIKEKIAYNENSDDFLRLCREDATKTRELARLQKKNAKLLNK